MDGSACVAQNGADMNLMNQKLQYDAAAALQNQSLIDNQSNARAPVARSARG